MSEKTLTLVAMRKKLIDKVDATRQGKSKSKSIVDFLNHILISRMEASKALQSLKVPELKARCKEVSITLFCHTLTDD